MVSGSDFGSSRGYGSANPMRGKSPTCRDVGQESRWSMTTRSEGVGDPEKRKARHRQVKDLPRIGVAEPVRE